MSNLKKASIASIVILVLIIGIAIASFAVNSGTITKEAKLRKQATNDSIVLEIIPKKEEVEVLAKEGDWYQVRYNKIKGYVQKDFIEVLEETSGTNTVQQEQQITDANIETQEVGKGDTVRVKSETKVYIRPLINSKVIKTIELNKEITISEIRNGWAYVNSDEVTGWFRINNNELEITKKAELNNKEDSSQNEQDATNKDEDNAQNTTDDAGNNSQTTNSKENSSQNQETSSTENKEEKSTLNKTAYISSSGINFREEPNTESKVLKVFAQNAKITILEDMGEWYKIKHNDQVGYVIKTYVSEKKVKTTSRSGENRTTSTTQATTETKATENKQEEIQPNTSSSNKGQEVANYVKQFVGCRYVYGGSTPNGGFDCSGLTMYVYKKFGVSLSHSATAQSKVGTKVDKANLQPGDLVFFKNYRTNKGIGHVGIYIGNNKFVHASTEKTGVITSTLTGSYNTRFVTATRFF